jgi:ASC-1-like (ASCH) protein
MAVLSEKTVLLSQKLNKDPKAHSLNSSFECLAAIKNGEKKILLLPIEKEMKFGDFIYLCAIPDRFPNSPPEYKTYPKCKDSFPVKVVRAVKYQNFDDFFQKETFSKAYPWTSSKEEFISYVTNFHPIKGFVLGPVQVVEIQANVSFYSF